MLTTTFKEIKETKNPSDANLTKLHLDEKFFADANIYLDTEV